MKAAVHLASAVLSLTVCVALVGSAVESANASDAEAGRLCRSDALRLCYSEIPDRDLITACMRKKQAQLSPACRAAFNEPPKPAKVETASRQ